MACASFILLVAFTANSCGVTHASEQPETAFDDVMKTIRDYGAGHAALLSPGTLEKPTEDSGLYQAHINTLLQQSNFAQLEKIAEQNRVEKGRLLGGYWKNHDFFDRTSSPTAISGALKDSDYQAHIELLNKWINAYPQSAAARISLAELYYSYGFFARGEGLANTVNDHQWELFNDRVALALQHLLVAAKLKERDPMWYAVMLMIAQAQGWDKEQTRELVDQAIAFEPDYYHYYRIYSQYLLPQWYGEPGDIQRFAEEVSARLPEPNSSIVYFQIVSSLSCYCRQAMEDLPHTSYPKLRQGYLSLTQMYGNDNIIANRFAFMATMAKDKSIARDAFAQINTPLMGIWYTQDIYDDSRQWAAAP
jgi:hypothetical protein